MEGFFPLTPAAVSFWFSSVSGAARAFQGRAAWGSGPYLSTRRCVGQLKNLSSCHCYPWSPGISSKWIWPLAKQPVHTSLIKVFLLDEKKEGVEREEERVFSTPAQTTPASCCMLDSRIGTWLWGKAACPLSSGGAGLCTSGVPHKQRMLKGRENNSKDTALHPAYICLRKKFVVAIWTQALGKVFYYGKFKSEMHCPFPWCSSHSALTLCHVCR